MARDADAISTPTSVHPVVVVVDDDEETTTYVCLALANVDIIAEACIESREAVAYIRQIRPRVVILDVAMPGVNGVEIFLALRADPETATMSIIFSTSDVYALHRRLPTWREQNVLLLAKPYTLADLQSTVQQALG